MDAATNNKLENTVLYLLQRSSAHRPASTVLFKMLWNADYWHYSNHLTSITGAKYVADRRGPRIERYRQVFEGMEARGLLSHSDEPNAKHPENPTRYYASVAAPDHAAFSQSELDVLEEVIHKCAHRTGSSLSRETHDRGEPWTLVYDSEAAELKPVPEVVWTWSQNLPNDLDISLARKDIQREHVKAALKKLRAEQKTENAKAH